MSLSSVRSQGLRNLGNTCFLNAVLQSLTSIKSFRKYLENRNSKFSHKLARTLQEIEEGDEVVETKDLINLGLKSKFRWLEQHDAQELFHHLMQVLEEEKKTSLFDLGTTTLGRGEDDAVSITSLFKKLSVNGGYPIDFAFEESPPSTSDEEECFSSGSSSCDEDVGSPLGSSLRWFCNDYEKNPFTGLVQNMLTCASCQNTKYRYERFLDLHLQPDHKTTCIQQLLRAYSQFQKIEDYACGKCCIGHCSSENLSSSASSSSSSASTPCSCAHHHKRVNCYSKVTMGRLPTALCLTLNRLATNEHFIYKRNTMIKYPVMLDMAPYWSFSERGESAAAVSSRTIKSSLAATTNIRLKYSPTDMSATSSAASSIESSIKAYTMYELQAVIVHHGGIDGSSGHFTTFRRDPCGGWVHTSDDMVVKVTEDCVLTQPAYMLFYEKKGM